MEMSRKTTIVRLKGKISVICGENQLCPIEFMCRRYKFNDFEII